MVSRQEDILSVCNSLFISRIHEGVVVLFFLSRFVVCLSPSDSSLGYVGNAVSLPRQVATDYT